MRNKLLFTIQCRFLFAELVKNLFEGTLIAALYLCGVFMGISRARKTFKEIKNFEKDSTFLIPKVNCIKRQYSTVNKSRIFFEFL